MNLSKTKSIIYTAPTTAGEDPNVRYVVDVVNVNEFFSCRFFIETKARADLKTDLTQRIVHSIVNSDSFHIFWGNNGVELPRPLDIVRIDKAHEQTYNYLAKSGQVTYPLWVVAFTEEHADSKITELLESLRFHAPLTDITRVK